MDGSPWTVNCVDTPQGLSLIHILRGERTAQDGSRFAGLKPVTARIKVEEENTKPISEHLIGVFFEDLN